MTARKSTEQRRVIGTNRADRHPPPLSHMGGVGAAPAHLSEELSAVWRELSAALPPGVGSAHDRLAFEVLARLVAKSRTGATTAADVAHLRGLFESFGLTPTGRQRLDVKPAGNNAPAKKASRYFGSSQ